MAYRVEVTPAAAREIKKLERTPRERVLELLKRLAEMPRPAGVKKLEGAKDLYRVRVGEFRVIYRVDDQELLVLVDRVRHGREAYRG